MKNFSEIFKKTHVPITFTFTSKSFSFAFSLFLTHSLFTLFYFFYLLSLQHTNFHLRFFLPSFTLNILTSLHHTPAAVLITHHMKSLSSSKFPSPISVSVTHGLRRHFFGYFLKYLISFSFILFQSYFFRGIKFTFLFSYLFILQKFISTSFD